MNTKRETEKSKCGGLIHEFLWVCSGANREVLRECPTEYAKYAGIGGTILFTSMVAMISGGYALFTVFESENAAIAFGIFWGLLIFNLDRFMVNTMYSDGKHTISKEEFLGGLPRLVLAIFLGIVISAPIEIRIFDDKIQSQIVIDQGLVSDDVRKANESLYNRQYRLQEQKDRKEAQLSEFKSGLVDGLFTRIAEKEKELSAAEKELYNETYGTGITKKRGFGPAAKLLQETVDRLKKELITLRQTELNEKAKNEGYIKNRVSQTQRDIENINRQLDEVAEQIREVENKGNKATTALNGFTARLKALLEITAFERDPMLFWARIMIMLLFIAIEVIPTIFKMMMDAGPYDDMLRAEKHRVRILADQRISNINDLVNTEVLISTEKNRKRIEAEILANKDVLEKIASVQSELLSIAIEKWRIEELAKIEANPSDYINTETTNIKFQTNDDQKPPISV